AILTIGVVPMSEVLPLLTEYIDEQHITHHSLLGKMSREDVMAQFASEPRLQRMGLTNYWGYNPMAMFALHPAWASSPETALD
ncbi:AroM family protein, partial [Salmonella enterica subsp. enterica serovar Kentucky]|nr:AroM family protein [Salmonella enterica subsp. enterica serovar Kentucky]